MRRKVGVSAVKSKQTQNELYGKTQATMEETKLTFVTEVMTAFQKSLSEFATKHKKRINSDPEFRQQFHAMCLSTGVDPLASGKGFWADILGVGDFYFELGVKIIQITVQTRSANGGIMSLKDLLVRIKSGGRLTHDVSMEDLMRAVDKLAILGGGFKIVKIAGNPMIISVPLELNTDHEYVLSVANDEGGFVTEQLMNGLHGWSTERFNAIITPLLQEGIIWADYYEGKERQRENNVYAMYLVEIIFVVVYC
jgi:ESCRT-II complex subunit VPS22